MWQRGSNGNINGQCDGCRIPATLRDFKSGKVCYTDGYLPSVKCIIDPDIGEEMLLTVDKQLQLGSSRDRGTR
jgi:hypothetical protein